MSDVPELVKRVAAAQGYYCAYDFAARGRVEWAVRAPNGVAVKEFSLEDDARTYCRVLNARAAIEAMREPTDEMLARVEPALDALYNGVKADPGYEAGGEAVFQAMIDGALGKDTPK